MSKFATKAAANMFCQARYEAAKSNERLSSREGAAEEIGIDRTRLDGLPAVAESGKRYIIAFFLVPFFNCTNTFLFL